MNAILPERIDNQYRGYRVGLWLFALVLLMRTVIGIRSIFDGYAVATAADGIPLATYGAAASQTVVALFALLGLAILMLSALGFIVLVRYRSAIPLMFSVLVVQHLAGRLIGRVHPIPRSGTPPGMYVNLVLLALMLAGLALSLSKRSSA